MGHKRFRWVLASIGLLALVAVLATCTDRDLFGPSRWTTPLGTVTLDPPEILVGAGDIAECNHSNDEKTANLLDGIPGTVFTAGDNVYDNGTSSEFQNCYDPSWGRHKARTRPVPGNHDYNTRNASGYFGYFGSAAGEAGKGYYSYDLGGWHIIALNNYVAMNAGSAQHLWLVNDLASTTQACKLAVYHEPLYSSNGGSGSGGTSTPSVRDLFTALYDGGVDVVVNGHRHFYERIAPMNPDGEEDPANGIREFVVGTGGAGISDPTNAFPLSEVRFGQDTHGVLKLYLYQDSYAWRFVPVLGKTLSDTGSYACHGLTSGIDPDLSTVIATPASITAGSGTSNITVAVKDSTGAPVSGMTVLLAATGAGNTLTQPSAFTDANGEATGSLSSTVAEPKIISVQVSGTPLSHTDTVTVTAGPLSVPQSTVTASPSTILPGSGTSVIKVTAKDTYGNPVSGTNVTLAATGSGNTLTQPSSPTDANGIATGTLSSTVEQIVTVSATADGNLLPQTAVVTVSLQISAAVTHTLLTAGNNPANTKVFTSAPIAPAPDALITVAVMGHRAYGATASPLVTGGGMAGWTQVATVTLDPVGSPQKRMTIYRAMSAAPGSGPLTIEFENTVSNAQWIVSQWSGVVTGGVNGAGAIRQTGSAQGDNTNGLTVPLAAFADANNVAYGVFGVRSRDADVSPGAGFAEIAEASSDESTPSDLQAEWATNVTNVAASWSLLNAAALGVEIVAGLVPAPSPTLSMINASPSTISPGAVPSTITVTVLDGSGTPFPGATVELAATGSGNTIDQPTGTTDANGEVTGTFTSTVAGLKTISATVDGIPLTQTAQVSVTAGPPSASQSIVVATPTSIPQGGAVADITVTVKDAEGNPVSGVGVQLAATGSGNTITQPAGLTDSAGVTTGSLSSLVAEQKTVSATADGTPLDQTVTVGVSQVFSAALSTVAAVPTSIAAGLETSTITVTANDANGDPMSGMSVTLAATGSGNTLTQPGLTDGSGQATGTLSSTTAEDKTVSAEVGGIPLTQEAVISVLPSGGVSALQSTVVAVPDAITAGNGTATITVTARDAAGDPIAGVPVVLAATGSGNTVTQPLGLTDVDGVATGSLASTVAEDKTVSATADGTLIAQMPLVTVTPAPVDADQSMLTAVPDTIAQGGEETSITVTARDSLGNPVPGATVVLNATGSGNTLTPTGPTGPDGVATATLSSLVAGEKIVSASANGTAITQAASVTVLPVLSATLSTVSADPGSIAAGTGTATITVTALDVNGDPMVGLAVLLDATGSGNTLTQPAGTTDVNGMATGALSSTVAEDKTVSVTVDGQPISEIAAVTVTAGPVDAAQSTVTADPNPISPGGQTSTITVQTLDAYGNAIAGATVVLAATGSGNTLTQPAAPTDATGVTTGTLSSTVAEAKDVSATVNGTLLDDTATVVVLLPVNITHTFLTGGNDQQNTKAYTTASIAPAPNALITVAVMGHRSSTATGSPIVSGGGMAVWEEVASVILDDIGSPHKRLTVFRAMSPSPGSGPLTITFEKTVSHAQWIVSQWEGVETTGVNGADAIGQTDGAVADAVSELTLGLAPFFNPNNVAYGVFGVGTRHLEVTPGAGFTEIDEQPSFESPASNLQAEWATNILTVQATWPDFYPAAVLGIEIKAKTTGP